MRTNQHSNKVVVVPFIVDRTVSVFLERGTADRPIETEFEMDSIMRHNLSLQNPWAAIGILLSENFEIAGMQLL